MKKILIFAVSAIMLTACSSDEIELNSSSLPTDNEVSVVFIRDGKMSATRSSQTDGQIALSFASESSFQKFKEHLSNVSDDEKLSITQKYGVANLHNIAIVADNELEEIANNATSETDFRTKYAEYKKKYEGILISNDLDSLDLTLYVPDEDNVETFIANANGVYVVNNEIRQANINKELSELVKEASTITSSVPSKTVTDINTTMFRPQSNKKIYFSAYAVGERLWVKMYAKKHMWYGWKNDPNRAYYYDSYLGNNFVYLMQGKNGQEIVASRLPRYIYNQNVKNGFNHILGKITDGNYVTGNFHLWCDITAEHDANGNVKTETKNGYKMPVCKEEKAHIVNIKIKRQN